MPEVSGSNRPSIEPLDIPDDVWAKAEAEMNQEAEGAAAPAAEPTPAEPETTEAPAPVETPAPTTQSPEVPDTSKMVEAIFQELDAIKSKLPEPEKKVAEPAPVPEAIQAALDHEDAVVQNLGRFALEQFNAHQAEIATIKASVQQQEVMNVADAMEPLIEAAVEKYGLSEVEEGKVVEYLTADPRRAEILTFEEGIQRTFPGRQPKATPAPAPPMTKGPKPGTLLDAGAAAAPPPRSSTPKHNQTIEEVVEEGFAKLNWRG